MPDTKQAVRPDAHDEISTLNFTDVPTLICQTWRPRITIETNYAYVRKYGLRHYRRMVLRDGAQFKIRRKDAGYFANPKRLIDTSVLAETVNDETECIEIDSEGQVPPLGRLIKQRKLGLALICYPVQAYHVRHLLPVLILLVFKILQPAQFLILILTIIFLIQLKIR